MCGIFGYTHRDSSPIDTLKIMGNLMIHRGPDDDSYYTDDSICLGMRRLSIIDLLHGQQPFFSHDNSVVVMCNGEIYNFNELKKELINKGYHFKTSSDVETIPHLYKEYGIDFVHKLNGMYAISLYDKNNQKLFLIRDRLGIKPLYYSLHRNNIIFSSELKPILYFDFISKEIDYNALSDYLDLLYIPSPGTPFKQISKLESGSYLEWTKKENKIVNYWNPEVTFGESIETIETQRKIEEILFDSIRMQLNSDVPIGSFLSGGIDSSLITALSAVQTEKEFTAFHIHWKNTIGKMDESSYAQNVVDKYGITFVKRDVNRIDVLNLLPKLIYYLEEPFADAAFIPTYFISQIASELIKVILNGAGGDELFGGYRRYKKHSTFKSIIGQLLYNKNYSNSYFDVRKTLHQRGFKKLFPWYNPDNSKDIYDEIYLRYKDNDPLNSMMYNDIKIYLQDDILFLTDKMSMANSIECRVPLLDHRLVELSLKIPSKLKTNSLGSKIIFKKVAEKYLPQELLYRKKEGFGFPILQFINRDKLLYYDDLLENGFLVKNNIIDKQHLRILTSKYPLNNRLSWFYWQILILEIWFSIYIGNNNYENIYNHIKSI